MLDDVIEPLDMLDEASGKPPESRVVTARGIRERIEGLRSAEITRSKRRATIAGLLNGNPPYKTSLMRELGRKNDANINLRTGEGIVDSAKTPYYDLVFETPRYLNIEVEWGDDLQRTHEWSELVSDGISKLIDDWDGYDGNTQLLQWQLCVHGIGIPLFKDTLSFKWESVTVGKVFVPDDAKADIDLLDECALPRTYLPTELYQLIKNEKVARSRGWNIELARNAIVNASPEGFRRINGYDWEPYEEAIRTGDVAFNNKSDRILVIDYFIREYDGTITHCILLDDTSASPADTFSVPEDDFLFKRTGRFENFSQILCPFFFDVVGEGFWHGVKGLGPKIFDFCELENRLTGKNIDQAMLGLVVVPKNADDWQTIETVSASGVTFFRPGTEFVQTKLADNLEGPLMVKRDLLGMLQSNTGQYRQRVSEENPEPTLGQAQMNMQQQAILSKGAVNRYYRSLDRLLREMVRRILNPKLSKSDPSGKEVMEFRDWCEKKGVPKECLMMKNIRSIKAVRSMGYGSPGMREVIGNRLLSLIPMMNEKARNNAQRTIIAPYVGQEHVDEFFPRLEEPDLPGKQQQQAVDENNALRTLNGETQVTYLDNHLIHFDNHFSDMAQHIQELQQGQAQPMEVLIHLHQGGVHTKAHLNGMAVDPSRKAQFEQRQAAWLQMTKVADQLQQQLQEQAKAQAAAQPQQPQMDPAALAAIAKVHGELQLKQIKMQGDMQLKAEKQQIQSKLSDLKAAHDMRLQTMKAAQDATISANAAVQEQQQMKEAA